MRPVIARFALPPVFLALLLLAGCSDVGTVQIPLWDLDDEGDEESTTVSEVVIGQPDAQSGGLRADNPAANTLNSPRGNMLWHDGRLYIPDSNNHRVVVFDGIPDSPDPSATWVLGQPDLDTASVEPPLADTLFRPRTAAANNDNVFAIADTDNHRVLIWDEPPQSQNDTPDTVLGQPGFQSAVDACTGADTMRSPTSVWLDNDRLIVADSGNHRVLIWNTIPDSNGATADVVLGQEDGENCFANRGTGLVEAGHLNAPSDIWSDGELLIIADSDNHRVLLWEEIPGSDGADADVVIGQADMQTGMTNSPDGLISDRGFNTPRFLTSNGTRLFIADRNNSRIVILNQFPDSDGVSFDSLIGQPDFETRNQFSARAGNFRRPSGLLWTGDRLLVADENFHRVQIFEDFGN